MSGIMFWNMACILWAMTKKINESYMVPYGNPWHLNISTFHLGAVVVGVDLVHRNLPNGAGGHESSADERQDEEGANGKVSHGG